MAMLGFCVVFDLKLRKISLKMCHEEYLAASTKVKSFSSSVSYVDGMEANYFGSEFTLS